MILLAAVAQVSSFAVSIPNADSMFLIWKGATVLEASGKDLNPKESSSRESASAVFLGYPHGPRTAEFVPEGETKETYRIEVSGFHGRIATSTDSFACSDARDTPVGSIFGGTASPLANAIYDRKEDWLIRFSGRPKFSVAGKSGYVVDTGPCTIEFKPNYYRDHLGYFLWDRSKPLWKKPIAGWCSWMAYLQKVDEQEVVDAAKFFGEHLRPYGYDVIQIDDGYQRVLQFGQEHSGDEKFSDYWTKPNEKFPHGMRWLADQIKASGMTPGVWIGYYLPLGLQHSEGYVTDPDGKPHKGPWVNYAMNGYDKAAIDEAYIDSIREFKRQGWDYFKIDTLRHILYDNYRQTPEYWKGRGQSMEMAYRKILEATKKAAGNSYVLACWGTLPELAGLPDGARIGEDVGADFDSMRRTAKYIAQFQYLNNVVWHNDPDYMCFRVPIDQARTWATMNFLAGGHLMVSDPVEDYDAEHLDALRRVGPPIFTRPLNAVSLAPDPEFMRLDASKDGEDWTVLARLAWKDLPPAVGDKLPKKCVAFDFWSKEFLGVVDSPSFHALKQGQCQVISLRPFTGRPQVLGDDRHLSQGAYELENVRWDAGTLSGKLMRGPEQAWTLYIYVPKKWKATASSNPFKREGEVLSLTFPIGAGPIGWSVKFEKEG